MERKLDNLDEIKYLLGYGHTAGAYVSACDIFTITASSGNDTCNSWACTKCINNNMGVTTSLKEVSEIYRILHGKKTK